MIKNTSTIWLIERLARLLTNDEHSEDLKPTQWEALRYLARANRFSRNPSAVTAYLGTTKGTVSQTLSALTRKGLVKKTADPTDKRSVQLALTKLGYQTLQRDPLTKIAGQIAQIEGMTDLDAARLSEGLQRVLTGLLDARGGRPFGACQTCRHFKASHKHGSPHYCALLAEPLTAADSKNICIEQDAAA